MRRLYYPGHVVDDLVHSQFGHRVLGPDTAGGYVVVVSASYNPVRSETVAYCRPLLPEQMTHVVRDPFRQLHLPAGLIESGAVS